MRKVPIGLMCFIFLYTFILSEKNFNRKIDPNEYLIKADNAVKIDPDGSMDLAKSVLLFIKGSDNKVFEIKANLIIGKAYFYKSQFKESLKIFTKIKARISLIRINKQQVKLNKICSETFYYLGKIYSKLNRYKKSVENYEKGLKYCIGDKSPKIKSKILVGLSRGYILLSDFELAISYAIKGFKSAEKSKDVDSLFFSLYLHGYVYRELKDYSKGLSKFNKSLEVAEKYNRPDLRVRAINEISNIYIFQKKYEPALKLKKEAIKISEQKDMKDLLSYCLNDIAIIFSFKKEYKKALFYLTKSRELAENESDIRGIVISDMNIADLYKREGDYSKSIEIYNRALIMAKEHDLKIEIMKVSEYLSDLLFREKKYKEAYKLLSSSYSLNSEIFNLKKSSRIAELEIEIEMEKSENKILLLEKINKIKQLELDKQNKFITIQKVTTFLLLIIVSLIFLAYRWKRNANLELKKKSEELEKTLGEVHKLSGLLPICSSCKKIRDDSGYWHQVEEYINIHSEASFSHSVCPSCLEKIYPDTKYGKSTKSEKKRKKK